MYPYQYHWSEREDAYGQPAGRGATCCVAPAPGRPHGDPAAGTRQPRAHGRRAWGCHVISVARWERGTRNPHGELRRRYARLLQLLDEVATAAEGGRAEAS